MNPPTDRERPALSEVDRALNRRAWRTNIGLRLTEADGEWLVAYCERENRSMSNFIELLIRRERASPKPALSEALDVFMLLGRPQGTMPAFCDMHPDDIVFKDNGVLVTVGDVRLLQSYLKATGIEPKDRLTKLMKALPEGSRQ